MTGAGGTEELPRFPRAEAVAALVLAAGIGGQVLAGDLALPVLMFAVIGTALVVLGGAAFDVQPLTAYRWVAILVAVLLLRTLAFGFHGFVNLYLLLVMGSVFHLFFIAMMHRVLSPTREGYRTFHLAVALFAVVDLAAAWTSYQPGRPEAVDGALLPVLAATGGAYLLVAALLAGAVWQLAVRASDGRR